MIEHSIEDLNAQICVTRYSTNKSFVEYIQIQRIIYRIACGIEDDNYEDNSRFGMTTTISTLAWNHAH